jgi:hypothetical protein
MLIEVAWECGELSMAVLRKSGSDVNQILARDPGAIDERNGQGQTPLHLALALSWDEGLELLLPEAHKHIVDEEDYDGIPLLLYACMTQNVKSLRRILQYDCTLAEAAIFQASLNSSSRCHKGLLISALRHKRIQVPEYQQTSTRRTTVFHIQYRRLKDSDMQLNLKALSRSDAKKLFAYGFRDIDAYDYSGLTPLMSLLRHGSFGFDSVNDLEYGAWLISKGASLSNEPKKSHFGEQRAQGSIAQHFYTASIGQHVANHFAGSPYDWVSEFWECCSFSSRRLFSSLLAQSNSDNCICGCSTFGCTSLTAFLEPLFSDSGWYLKHFEEMTYTSLLKSILPILPRGHGLDPVDFSNFQHQLIRAFTFERLGLTHTCCEIGWDETTAVFLCRDQEDMEEIREEESISLGMFNELVESLQKQFDELVIPLVEFFEEYWEPSMEKEERRDSSETWDEEEVRNLEEIGVVLER